MRYFSMFTGVGGFELGIKQAYDDYCNQRKIQTKQTNGKYLSMFGGDNVQEPLCVGFSEIDKYASQLLQIKFPETKNYGDATLINEHELPDFDLLCGGFPCQSFSIAGKRKGFDDTRGTLFFDIARILAYKKPKRVLLENVKGLLSHDGGETFQTILRVLTDLGYFVEWQVLNSKNFGVPQNRERVFIIGYLGGEPRSKVFPIGESSQKDTRVVGQEISRALDANYYKGVSHSGQAGSSRQLIQLNTPTHSNDKVYGEDGISPTLNTMQAERRQPFIALSPETCYNGSNANATKTRPDKTLQVLSEVDNKTEIQQRRADVATSLQKDAVLQSGVYEKGLQGSLQNGQAQMDGSSLQGKANLHEVGSMRDLQRAEENGDTSQRPQRDKQQSAKSSGAMSGLPHEATSDKGSKNLIPQEAKKRSWAIRRLTPLEAERLQGFPDNWTANFSDTQRYKMMGNAVTVNVVQEIISRMIRITPLGKKGEE